MESNQENDPEIQVNSESEVAHNQGYDTEQPKQNSYKFIYLVLGGIFLAFVVFAGGYVYFKATAEKEVSNVEVSETQEQEQSQFSDLIHNKLIGISIAELGIKFDYPNDWTVSEVSSRALEGGIEVRQLRVYPKETDPTVVWFFVTDEPLEKVRDIELAKANTDGSTFSNISINGLEALQRVDTFSTNECTKTVTLIEKDGKVYGSEIVECPTHDDGYDEIRANIANSLILMEQDNSKDALQTAMIETKNDRHYIAPKMYIDLPSEYSEISATIEADHFPYTSTDAARVVRVPMWTLRDEVTRKRLGYIRVLDTNDRNFFTEEQTLKKYGSYTVHLNQTIGSSNDEVLKESIVGKIPLEGTELSLVIEIPFADEPVRLFKSLEQAQDFLQIVMDNLVFDSEFLITASQSFSQLKTSLNSIDEEDGFVKLWPTALFTSMMYSELQQISLEKYNQRTGDENSSTASLCKDIISDRGRIFGENFSKSFLCNSSSAGIVMSVNLDNDVYYCIDSNGYEDLQTMPVPKNAFECRF